MFCALGAALSQVSKHRHAIATARPATTLAAFSVPDSGQPGEGKREEEKLSRFQCLPFAQQWSLASLFCDATQHIVQARNPTRCITIHHAGTQHNILQHCNTCSTCAISMPATVNATGNMPTHEKNHKFM